MKENPDQPADAAELRRRAEEQVRRQRPTGGGQTTALEMAQLVHELQVHQIELEMQNEELQQARAQAETLLAQYTDLYNCAPAGYMTLDREGAIQQVNVTGARLFGVERARLVNRRFGLFVAEGDRRTFSDFLQRVFASQTNQCCEVTLPQDGSQALVLQIESTRSADGQECRAVVLDITERLQLEAQFRQAQKMDSVGQLASGIAHDFNNLLTVINGTSDLLLEQVGKDDPMHADVQEILHAGQRAAALTRQLLAFSRRQILESRVLNLNTVVAGMESLLRRLIGEDVALVVVPTPGLGSVKADSGQIEQVLTNLAVNARDAMPQGGQLTIETQNVTIDEDSARQLGITMPPGSYVLLTVSDAGVGMDAATRTHIFEPFFTTKGPGKGTGLGLSTVYGIVTQSHGFIGVESAVGRGTRFKIYLPQVTEAADTDRPAPTVVSRAGTETILLVEDNAGLRKLATRFLEPAGYTVLGAATGEEALRLLEHHEKAVHLLVSPVHLLLSDVVLPGISGRQLAEQIAQTHPGTKVLYMSGYTSDTTLRHGVLEAQVAFLNKPFTAAALLQKVREVLDS